MYAVIFTVNIKEVDDQYSQMAQSMRDLVFSKYGCEEFNSSTEGDVEIAISYWQDLKSIQEWKKDLKHLEAQSLGKQKWYSWYKVEIAKIERSYTHRE